MILGAVLAGGQATRFGSDKALATIAGRTLLTQAVDLLSGWCEFVVVVGRAEGPAPTLPDRPRAGMGPLGGIAAALTYAVDEGYESVLTIGVDCAELPEDLPQLLSPAPRFLADQPVIGHWPASAAGVLDDLLASDMRHSAKAFAAAIGALPVMLANPPANINTTDDLAALARRSSEA